MLLVLSDPELLLVSDDRDVLEELVEELDDVVRDSEEDELESLELLDVLDVVTEVSLDVEDVEEDESEDDVLDELLDELESMSLTSLSPTAFPFPPPLMETVALSIRKRKGVPGCAITISSSSCRTYPLPDTVRYFEYFRRMAHPSYGYQPTMAAFWGV